MYSITEKIQANNMKSKMREYFCAFYPPVQCNILTLSKTIFCQPPATSALYTKILHINKSFPIVDVYM
jgi:hypothetical protein